MDHHQPHAPGKAHRKSGRKAPRQGDDVKGARQTFWNHFYGNCSILELETDGKSNILELEALISAGIGFFGASSNLGLVQLEVLLGLLWCVLGVG